MVFRKTKEITKSSGKTTTATLSVIAQDTHILGSLISGGSFDFEGTINGNISCHTLTIRKNANVKGDIKADTLNVYGKIEGIIHATNVNLYSGCHVEGIILHENISIENGAFMDGKCKRIDKVSENDYETENSENTVYNTAIRLIS